jgi:hypothetical protein
MKIVAGRCRVGWRLVAWRANRSQLVSAAHRNTLKAGHDRQPADGPAKLTCSHTAQGAAAAVAAAEAARSSGSSGSTAGTASLQRWDNINRQLVKMATAALVCDVALRAVAQAAAGPGLASDAWVVSAEETYFSATVFLFMYLQATPAWSHIEGRACASVHA